MRVARHEMPGRCQRKRPSQRDVVVGSANGAFDLGHDRAALRNHTVPKRDGSVVVPIPGISCLATIVQSLRDRKTLFSNRLLGRIRSTPVAAELRLFHHCRGTWNIRSLISRFGSRN